MSEEKKIEGTAEAWDSRELGCEEKYARVSSSVNTDSLDESLELQMISIRLQKSLIEDFKMIAKVHGLGYQPLIRQALNRFADSEKKRIVTEVASRRAKERKEAEKSVEMEVENQQRAVG